MAADGEVKVNIKVTSENGGVVKSEQGLKRIKEAAQKTASESKSGFEQMQAGVGKVSGAFGALRNVLTGFGIGALVTTMTAGIAKIASSFGASKKSAEEFAEVQQRLSQEKGIANLATDYEKLTDAIAAAAEAENHQLEMIDIEVANRRKLAAAKMDAAKENEIAALDANAEDYAEKLEKINRKYAAIKAVQDAGNAREDIVLARQKMNAQADQADAQAMAQEKSSEVIKAKIAQAKREKSKADNEAVDLNEADKTTAVDAVGKTIGQLFSGDWGRMSEAKTAEGDAVRKAAAEKSAELEKQIMALTEELRKSNEAASKLRRDAANTREKAKAMGGALEAAEITGDTARKATAREEKNAQTSLEKKQTEISDEAAKLADARRAKELLTQQKAEVKASIKAEEDRKAAAGRAVYEAQGNFDLARANGAGRSQQTAAFNALQEAKTAAQNVDHSADSAINALKKTLESIDARLKAASSYLESKDKQTKSFMAETPAGS